MSTGKLYQKNPYLNKSTATIVDVTSSKDGFLLVLDETIFFPTGGGQSCDKGKINDLEVINVYETEDLIYHEVQCNNSNIVLTTGDKVSCSLDWEHRFLNMQRHCGEHILSGIFHREYGGVNRGFHMGDGYMTIDISLEEDSDFQTLTWDMAMNVEQLANEVVWSNAPVITRYFTSLEETVNIPLRKKLAVENDIVIVCVGNVDNPSDCVACCGTHPSTAGQVGLIKILKVESYKGMFRVYCDAGKNAMQLFDNYHEILTKLNNKYSASTDDLLSKMQVQEDKTKVLKAELHTLRQSVIAQRISDVEREIESCTPSVEHNYQKFIIRKYSDMKVEDLLNIGRPLVSKLSKLLLIVSIPENTLLLFSNGKIDCGKLVKENAEIYQGKGGGNNTSARALFTKAESIDTFIDLIDKHLR